MASSLRHLKECPVCYEDYEEPKILPCDHTFCKHCLARIKRGTRVKCPVCNALHDADKVRADFRLSQFLDVLKEHKDGDDEENAETSDTVSMNECELCGSNPIAFHCDQCQQWLCLACKNVHLRSKASKDHKLTPISLKNQEVKDKFEVESKGIKEKMKQCKRMMDDLHEKEQSIKRAKTETIARAEELKGRIEQDINAFFEEVEQKINNFAQDNLDDLQNERNKYENGFEKLEGKWNQFEKAMKENSDDLAVKGKDLLRVAKNTLPENIDTNFEVQDMSMQIFPGKAWDVANAAKLELRKAEMLVKPCHATACNLSELQNSHFIKQHEVSIQQAPKSLRHIKQQLWVCQENGVVQVFDENLELKNTIANAARGTVYDIAVLPSGEFVLACSRGLYHIDAEGHQLHCIDDDFYSSVVAHSNCRILAFKCGWGKIVTYRFDTKWSLLDQLKVKTGWNFVTIGISGPNLITCRSYDSIFHVLSIRGNIVQDFRNRDRRVVDRLSRPYLCQQDEAGSNLIADFDTHCIHLMMKNKELKKVRMHPEVTYPRGCVFTGGKLYVASAEKVHSLSSYIQH